MGEDIAAALLEDAVGDAVSDHACEDVVLQAGCGGQISQRNRAIERDFVGNFEFGDDAKTGSIERLYQF